MLITLNWCSNYSSFVELSEENYFENCDKCSLLTSAYIKFKWRNRLRVSSAKLSKIIFHESLIYCATTIFYMQNSLMQNSILTIYFLERCKSQLRTTSLKFLDESFQRVSKSDASTGSQILPKCSQEFPKNGPKFFMLLSMFWDVLSDSWMLLRSSPTNPLGKTFKLEPRIARFYVQRNCWKPLWNAVIL